MHHGNKCAHAPCGCPVGEGEKYCSTYCTDSGKVAEQTCGCGHRGCTQQNVPKGDPASGE
jgi:hypothetical protein